MTAPPASLENNISPKQTRKSISVQSRKSVSMKKYYDHEVQDFLTVLHCFCRQGARDVNNIRTIIDLNPQLVNQVTPTGGDTPLHFAVAANDVAVTKLLLKADPSTAMIKSTKYGFFGDQFTPLHVAIVNQCSLEIIKALVQACPRAAKIRSGEGFTVQDLALKYYQNGNDLAACLNIISSLRRTASGGKAMSDTILNRIPSRSDLKKQTTPQA